MFLHRRGLLEEYQLINLDYEGPLFTKGEQRTRIEVIESLIINQANKNSKRFLLLLTVLGARGNTEQINSILKEAEESMITTTNNAKDIFQFLRGNQAKQYEKLFVCIPILVIYYGGTKRYDTICSTINIYKGGNQGKSWMVHFVFEFNYREDKILFVDNSRFEPIPLQNVTEIEEGEIKPFKTEIPRFEKYS